MATKKTATAVATVKGTTTPKPGPAKIVRVNPETKLTPTQVDILGLLHSTARQHTVDEIKTETGANVTPAILTKLAEAGLAQVSDKGKWSFTGKRVKALKQAVDQLRVNGAPMGAGELGALIWGDPKKAGKDPKAGTRYFAAASALLSGAFTLGAVYRMSQDGKTVGYGSIA
jgi:hypothetical protein